jgi:hypothetical protein
VERMSITSQPISMYTRIHTMHTQPETEMQIEAVGDGDGDRGQIPQFLAGDIILFAGQDDLYGKASRWLMRGDFESPTYAVHTAQFLDPRRVLEMDFVGRIRTVSDVLNNKKRYKLDMWRRRGLEVWRCRTLTDRQRHALTRCALTYVNVKFGTVKCMAHILDDLLGKMMHRGIYFFRRIDPADRHPVCSGITATVYDKALHYRFGVEPQCADPDQIHDWVTGHPDKWTCVFHL